MIDASNCFSITVQKVINVAMLAALFLCNLGGMQAGAAESVKAQCDRQCLESFIDEYLKALAENDPAGLPLADNVVFVENDQSLKLGDGTWRTITGLGKYRHYFADPETGQVAVMTTLKENGSPIMFDLRLKIVDKKIAEIEDMPIRTEGGAELLEKLGKPWPEFRETIPVAKRVSREQLAATANKYLSGINQPHTAIQRTRSL
jgi:type II secretory pathway pseudopilin PulG